MPNEERETFYSHYLGILAERFPIMGDFTGNWTEISQKPNPRLYLKEESGELVFRIRFDYGDIELEYDRSYPETTVKVSSEEEVKLIRVHRCPELEKEYWSGLSEFGLKRGLDGAYLLRSKLTPVDFLFRYIPKLVQAGYEVFGHEDLKSAKINRSKPTISLGVSSGIDCLILKQLPSLVI